MSFLLDPPTLVILGVLLSVVGERYRLGNRRLWIVGGAIVAVFWIVSVALYLDMVSFPGMLTAIDTSAKGSTFMFHTTITGLKKSEVPRAVVAVMFLLYPVWLYIGYLAERRIFQRS